MVQPDVDRRAKSVQDLILQKWGVRTRSERNPLISTVGATATRMLRADANRYAFILMNLSVNNLFIAPDDVPSTTNGILIGANGGLVAFNWEEDFILPSLEWFAVGSAAATNFFLLTVLGEAQ